MKINILFMVVGLVILGSYYLSYLYVFITAYLDPNHTAIVLIDSKKEAALELSLILLSFPFIIYFYIKSMVILKEAKNANRKTAIR